MPSTMHDPFFVELSALQLAQNSVFEDSSATEPRQARNKEGERPERDQARKSNQHNRGQLEVCEVSAVIKDLVTPGRRDYSGCAERDWRERG